METNTLSKTVQTIPLKGMIQIAAFRPKTQLPVTCRPLPDRTGKHWTGQGEHGYYELLSAKEKETLRFIITPDTTFVLEDGKVLKEDDMFDVANWQWLQRHPYLTLDKEKKTSDVVYYVVNPQKEAKAYVDNTAKQDEARPAVRRLSESDRQRVAQALGLNGAHTFAPEQLLQWLLQRATSTPEAVLDTIDPKNRARVSARIFFDNAVRWGIIKREKDGVFYFGGPNGATVGHSDEVAITYLIDPKNVERVKAMKAMLAEKTKVKEVEEKVEEPAETAPTA